MMEKVTIIAMPHRLIVSDFLFDVRGTSDRYIYVRPTSESPRSGIYKISRTEKALVLQNHILNRWTMFGTMDMTLSGKLIASGVVPGTDNYAERLGNKCCPSWIGPLTYVWQPVNTVLADTLTSGDFVKFPFFCQSCESEDDTASCIEPPIFPSTFTVRVDRHSKVPIAWVREVGDWNHDSIYAFDPEQMYRLAYVSKTSFGPSPDAQRRVMDMETDGEGNLWVSVGINGGVESLLYRVRYIPPRCSWDYGACEPRGDSSCGPYSFSPAVLMKDLTDAIGSAGWVRWVAEDNTLVVASANQGKWVKYDIASGDIIQQLTFPFSANQASFHHPFDSYNSVWIAGAYLGNEPGQPTPPPGSFAIYPKFTEIDLISLTVKREVKFRTGMFPWYPLQYAYSTGTKPFYGPDSAIYDIYTGCIWASEVAGGHIGEFCFGDIPPPPPPPPPEPPPGGAERTEYCVSRVLTLKTVDSRILSLGPNTRAVSLRTVDSRVITLT